MEAYDFIKKNTTRVMIIWLSCFDKARTTEEIGKIWGYSAGKVLLLGKIPSKMLEYKLLKVEKLERKQIYFRSSFEIYIEILRKFSDEINIEMSKKFYQLFLKQPEFFLKIIDSEEYREMFLNVFSIKKLCNNNRDLAGDYNNALGIPLLGLIFLTVLKIFRKIRPNMEFEKIKTLTCENFKISWKFVFPIINLEEYVDDVKEKLNEKTFEKLTQDLEKTDLYKEYSKFAKLLESVLSIFLK
ncbi:MAG: hypothetical protein QW228_03090 [Candidatus Aenigmatarchaeota archaeon]